MAFAQLTFRESLRDIEVNLPGQARRLYHDLKRLSYAIWPNSGSD
jgi:hypothetical protein